MVLLPLPALAAIREQCDWARVARQHKSSRPWPGLGQVLRSSPVLSVLGMSLMALEGVYCLTLPP